MRNAFIKTLCDLAAADDRMYLVCGDLGYNVLDAFAGQFPGRYLNAGVAEQNMIGLAAGLAMAGKTVFVYSIVNFPIMRCLEQIRNDVCYHNLNVKIVAVGGGYSYGGHGYTHHGVEDLAVLRVLPNMTVLAPGDPAEAAWATREIARLHGPCYLRLGKGGEPAVHDAGVKLELGRAAQVRAGRDITLITTGAVLPLAVAAADALATHGVSAGVLSMHTLWPLDQQALAAAAAATHRLLTVEEHAVGGLASAVAETLAESGTRAAMRSVRLSREPLEVAGSQAYLRGLQGLSVEGIVQAVRGMV